MQLDIIEKSFDFSVRVLELIDFLEKEGRIFPLSERLLLCGSNLGTALCLSNKYTGTEKKTSMSQALAYAVECGYLLKLMVKTGYLTELQSKRIRIECEAIQSAIGDLLSSKKTSGFEYI